MLKEDISRGSCVELAQYLAAGGDSNLGHIIDIAVTHHNVEAIKLLQKHGASLIYDEPDPNWGPYTALHVAAFNGYPDLVRMFLPYFPDVDAKWQINTTALHEACMRRCGHDCPAWDIREAADSPDEVSRFVECARVLLEAGANVNAPCTDWPGPEYNYTPLHFASHPSCQPLIDLLLAWGADPSRQDSDGKTPAMYANRQ